MTTYTAGWNMPGYLPETDPETFDTLEDAAEWLRDLLECWLEDDEAPETMTAASILTIDREAEYVDGWYTPARGGAEYHLWAHRDDDAPTDDTARHDLDHEGLRARHLDGWRCDLCDAAD